MSMGVEDSIEEGEESMCLLQKSVPEMRLTDHKMAAEGYKSNTGKH